VTIKTPGKRLANQLKRLKTFDAQKLRDLARDCEIRRDEAIARIRNVFVGAGGVFGGAKELISVMKTYERELWASTVLVDDLVDAARRVLRLHCGECKCAGCWLLREASKDARK
jgi:hypothetical protein